jgi:hypothetical protein
MRPCLICYQPEPELHRQLARRRWRSNPLQLAKWLHRDWSLMVLEDDVRRHLAHHELPLESTRERGDGAVNARSRAVVALLWRARLLTATQIQTLLYPLSGASAQTACSRDLRHLRERRLTVRSTLPAGQSLALGERIVRRAACYSLTARQAGTRGRERAGDWSWPVQQGMLDANQAFIDLHQAARVGGQWDLPLGGWNAHLRLDFEDQVTRRRLRWRLDALVACVELSSRAARALCIVHDPGLEDATAFLGRHVPPWRSLCVDSQPLAQIVAAGSAAPGLMIVSHSPQRSRDLADAIAELRAARVAGAPPIILVDQPSLPWLFTEAVALVEGNPERAPLGDVLAQMFGTPWQAEAWQMNGDPRAEAESYTGH